MRPSGRAQNQLRKIQFLRHFTKYAEGSILVTFGDTKVICNASVKREVPRFLKGKKQGWVTAEYSMLPRATHERTDREATRGKQGGRTLEIQRLIGRSLRAIIDLKALGEYSIIVDCDVIQADGGTRAAAITGGCMALVEAVQQLLAKDIIKQNPLSGLVASVSVGIYQGEPILDLEYAEDCNADTDMNVVMNDNNEFIEVQGTAEGQAFSTEQLTAMLQLARTGITELIAQQRAVLEYMD